MSLHDQVAEALARVDEARAALEAATSTRSDQGMLVSFTPDQYAAQGRLHQAETALSQMSEAIARAYVEQGYDLDAAQLDTQRVNWLAMRRVTVSERGDRLFSEAPLMCPGVLLLPSDLRLQIDTQVAKAAKEAADA